MKFTYPLKVDNENTNPNLVHLKGATCELGFFPIGRLNIWHGGIHFTSITPMLAIADGEIIAYRLQKNYLETAIVDTKMKWSNSFVLIRHKFVSEKATKPFYFYSLYNHLRCFSQINEHRDQIPKAFARNKYKVLNNAKDTMNVKGIYVHRSLVQNRVFVIPTGSIVEVDTNLSEREKKDSHWSKSQKNKANHYQRVKLKVDKWNAEIDDLYVATSENYARDMGGGRYKITYSSKNANKSYPGAALYDKPNGSIIDIIPKNAEIEVESENADWGIVKDNLKTVGYVQFKNLKAVPVWALTDGELDTIQIPDDPIPVAAGEIIGHVGQFGQETRPELYTSHVEVFSEENILPYLKKIDQDAKTKKTYIRINKGATLTPKFPYRISSADEIKLLEKGETYSRIHLEKLRGTVLREDLGDYTSEGNYYKITRKKDKEEEKAKKEETRKTALTDKFEYPITNKTKIYLDEDADAIPDSQKTRDIYIKIPVLEHEYWVKKDKLPADKKEKDVFETSQQLNELFLKKPQGEVTDVKTEATNYLHQSEIKTIETYNGTKWHFLDLPDNIYTPKQGYIKINDANIHKISAYDWEGFGFRLLEDKDNEFLYDNENPNPFLTEICKVVDSNGDSLLTQAELQAAFCNAFKVEQLSKMVVKHKSEWDKRNLSSYQSKIEQDADEAKKKLKKEVDNSTGPKKEEAEKRKERLTKLMDARLEDWKNRTEELCFWEQIKVQQQQQEPEVVAADSVSARGYFDQINVISPPVEEEEKETAPPFPVNNSNVYHYHPISFVEQMKRVFYGYRLGDKGNVVLEINIRLAGFGGLLPTEEYTELTEKGVKQFQRDYMEKKNPNGIADYETLEAIDEFSEKYRENINDYKCRCGVCNGFGQGQYNGEYSKISKLEMYHKYEYPGIHQSLLWAVSASCFYLTKKLDGKYSINKISSGYRCWEHSITKSKKTTNHLGKAVDLLFNKNGIRTIVTSEMEELREKLYSECIGAPKQGDNIKYNFGWEKNKFGLEPFEFDQGQNNGANSWIHLDVREFDRTTYLKDSYFISKITDNNFNKKISNIKN